LEHVIGFHDVLLLRPLDAKPQRPKGDPVGRWIATVRALDQLFMLPGLFVNGACVFRGARTRDSCTTCTTRVLRLSPLMQICADTHEELS
jgi:hypothetical protein